MRGALAPCQQVDAPTRFQTAHLILDSAECNNSTQKVFPTTTAWWFLYSTDSVAGAKVCSRPTTPMAMRLTKYPTAVLLPFQIGSGNPLCWVLRIRTICAELTDSRTMMCATRLTPTMFGNLQ